MSIVEGLIVFRAVKHAWQQRYKGAWDVDMRKRKWDLQQIIVDSQHRHQSPVLARLEAVLTVTDV
jgi:hypothetical protein